MTSSLGPCGAAQPGEPRPASGHAVPQNAAGDAPPPHTARERDARAAAVAAAMLGYVMAGAATPLRLETERIRRGVLLHITYPAGNHGGPAHHLTTINSAAERWGQVGDSQWHLLWAIVSARPAAPPTRRGA